MMFTETAGKQDHLRDSGGMGRTAGRLMTRRIWLPKVLYTLLPYFYLFAGVAALLATLYISNWLWVLPHYLLFSIACLHMGILIYRRRHRR